MEKSSTDLYDTYELRAALVNKAINTSTKIYLTVPTFIFLIYNTKSQQFAHNRLGLSVLFNQTDIPVLLSTGLDKKNGYKRQTG